jgi:hypothetical protein
MARDLVALAADLEPDVLVHENVEFGAAIAAARLGIPHVAAGALWFRPDLVGQFRHLALAVMPRSWVAPDETLPATVMFIRSEGALPREPLPAWLAELPSDRPLVHVTMGTTEVTRTPGLYETTLAALRDEARRTALGRRRERKRSGGARATARSHTH